MSGLFVAALLATAPLQDPVRAFSDRADELLDRLYADPADDRLLAEVRRLRDESLAAGATGVAEKLQGQVVYHRPASLPDRILHARILRARGRDAEAERDLRALVKDFPTDCTAHRMLADLFRANGDPRAAIAVHEAHLKEHPDEAAAVHDAAATALWDLRDPVAARTWAARMRTAAEAKRATTATAAWLRDNAAGIEEGAATLERDRAAVAAAESRAMNLALWAAVGAAAALGAAFRLTRPRAA